MTSIVWPPGLPDDVLVEGYKEGLPKVTVRTQMDAGPPKVRRRQTAAVATLSFSLDLTREQVALLTEFHGTTLRGGSLSFEWRHPRTRAVCQMRFIDPPDPRPLSGRHWVAACTVEVLP